MSESTLSGRPVATKRVFEEGAYWRWQIVMQDGTEYVDGGNYHTQEAAEAGLREALDPRETKMTNETYNDCQITQSKTCSATTGKPLYSVSGRFEKSAATRPFLPTRHAARDWIDDQITAEETASL